MNAEELKEMKRRFAAEILRKPGNAFEAALSCGLDTGAALRASVEWLNDEEVLAFKQQLLEDNERGELAFLPSKAEAARLAWDLANAGPFIEDRLKALKLYSDILGYIEKPSAVNVNNNVTNNRVMVVKDHGSNENWEENMRRQQAELTKESSGNASTKH